MFTSKSQYLDCIDASRCLVLVRAKPYLLKMNQIY